MKKATKIYLKHLCILGMGKETTEEKQLVLSKILCTINCELIKVQK